MPSKNVILTDDGLNRCMEQLKSFYQGDKRLLNKAIEEALKYEPLSDFDKKSLSRQTIDKYFRDGSEIEKDKGVSLLSFRIISYVLWSIEPGSDEENILSELIRPVDDSTDSVLYMKREALETDAPLLISEGNDPTDHIPQELPTLDIQPIGREKKLEDIHDALEKNSRVIVTGMPGVGKSLVALSYARNPGQTYKGGVYWLDAPDGDIALQIVEMAIAQGVVVPDTIEPFKQFRYCTNHWPLAPQPVLLVLDNVETEEELIPLLKWLPVERFKLLITARPQMRLANIKRVHLPVLATPTAVSIIRQILLNDDPRLADEGAALDDLCGELLGGLPLAVQVVGQVLRDNPYLSIKELNENLRATGNLFAVDMLADFYMADMLDDVRRGILAVFELSWKALSVDCQLSAMLISTFEPAQLPWKLFKLAAERVPDLHNPAASCSRLQRMSLLRHTGKNTVQMHRVLRGFFLSKMTDENPILTDAHHQALLTLCQQLPARCTASQAQEFVAIEPHVTAAIHKDRYDEEFYEALQCYFLGRGLYRQAYKWSEEALEQARETINDPIQLAYLLKQAGERAHLAALYEKALEHLEEARNLLKGDSVSKLMAQVLVILSATQRDVGQLDQAERTSRKALKLCQQYFDGDSPEVTEAGMTLATSKFINLLQQAPTTVDQDEMQALEQQVEDIITAREHHQLQDKSAIAESLNLKAKIFEAQAKNSDAIPLYRRAVELTEPPHIDAAKARNNLAKALESVAEESEVIGLYKEAIKVFAEADQVGDQGWCMKNLGVYYVAQGSQQEGVETIKQACDLLEANNDPRYGLCEDSLNAARKRIA